MNTTPIEFMAWLGDRGLYKITGFQKHENGITIYPLDNLGLSIDPWYRMYNETTELMQLTALRSINDEPIYNHQIVKDRSGRYKVVDMFNCRQMSALTMSKLEIVGNRFQHPELLEKCK